VLFLVCKMEVIVCDVIPQYMKHLETFLSSAFPLKRDGYWMHHLNDVISKMSIIFIFQNTVYGIFNSAVNNAYCSIK
jgi:hypothetical protein